MLVSGHFQAFPGHAVFVAAGPGTPEQTGRAGSEDKILMSGLLQHAMLSCMDHADLHKVSAPCSLLVDRMCIEAPAYHAVCQRIDIPVRAFVNFESRTAYTDLPASNACRRVNCGALIKIWEDQSRLLCSQAHCLHQT